MSMPILNKICTCIFCSEAACCVAQCIDVWASIEACGLAYLQCGQCCWIVCSPICHNCSMGSCSEGMEHCKKGIFYCLYSCALECVAPIDGCYNCGCYIKDVCGDGVSGFKDMLKNVEFLNKKVRECFGLSNGNEPLKSFNEYKP